MYCAKCGQQLPDDANFCLKCGAPQKAGVSATSVAPVERELYSDNSSTDGNVTLTTSKIIVKGQTIHQIMYRDITSMTVQRDATTLRKRYDLLISAGGRQYPLYISFRDKESADRLLQRIQAAMRAQ